MAGQHAQPPDLRRVAWPATYASAIHNVPDRRSNDRRPRPPPPARSRENLNASVFAVRVIVNVKHKDSSNPSASSKSSISGRVIEEGYQCHAYRKPDLSQGAMLLAPAKDALDHRSELAMRTYLHNAALLLVGTVATLTLRPSAFPDLAHHTLAIPSVANAKLNSR